MTRTAVRKTIAMAVAAQELGWGDFRRQAILTAMRGDRSSVEDLIATMSVILAERVQTEAAPLAAALQPVLPSAAQTAALPTPIPTTTPTTPAPVPHSLAAPPANEATPLGTPRRPRRRRGMPLEPFSAGPQDGTHAVEDAAIVPPTLTNDATEIESESPLVYVDPAMAEADQSGL